MHADFRAPGDDARHGRELVRLCRSKLRILVVLRVAADRGYTGVVIMLLAAVSGVIGLKKPLFDVWGDTVRLASRMESTSEAGQFRSARRPTGACTRNTSWCRAAAIELKGVGSVETYYLTGRKAAEVAVETSHDALDQNTAAAGPIGVAELRTARTGASPPG